MKFDLKEPSAELILCAAIDDLARKTGISADEIRNDMIESGAYDALFDYNTGLWKEGPDYFADFYMSLKEKS